MIELNKREYEVKTALSGKATKYIRIPLSFILDDEIGKERIAVLSYFLFRYGLNNIVGFTVPSMVEWCGEKPNNNKGRTNETYLNVIDGLNDRGYLTYLNEPSKSKYMECEFESETYEENCKGSFATLYLDEIEKILKYKKKNVKDTSLTNTTILLVFAYFRARIYNRPNKLKPEELNTSGDNNIKVDIKNRRNKNPEAYEDSFKSIAEDLGISDKTLIRIVDTLEEELGLIVTDKAYRVRDDDGEYKTPHTIFANAYKREKGELLATGEKYSRSEIEAKAERLNEKYGNYKINKTKRKTKKGE